MIKKFGEIPTRLSKSFLLKHRSTPTRVEKKGAALKKCTRRYFQADENTSPAKKTRREESHELRKPFNYKTQLCKFFVRGLCNRGMECTFSHDTRAFPCHAYHLRNNCPRKVCRFSHVPITLEQLKQLKEEEGCEDFEFMSTFQNST